MKKVTFEIEDNETIIPFIVQESAMPAIVAGHCKEGGYEPEIWDIEKLKMIPNPLTPVQFAWQRTRDFGTLPGVRFIKSQDVENAINQIPEPEIIVKGT